MNVVTPTNPPVAARPPVGAALVFAVFGAPAAWLLQLFFGYALAAHACYPIDVPLVTPVWGPLWWILIGIELAAIVIAGGGLFTAWSCHVAWRGVDPRNVGERRNRFIAKWALLTSALFSIAVVFTIVMLFIMPVCNY
jgi:hypothetical protein